MIPLPYGKIGLTLLVVFSLAIGGWGIYAGLIRPITKPNPTTTQNAENITNYNYPSPKVYFGCINYAIKGETKK